MKYIAEKSRTADEEILQHAPARVRDAAFMSNTGRRSTSERFRTNLQKAIDYRKSMHRYTIADLATKSEVSERMIHSILAGESRPTVDVAEAIGRAVGFSGWALLLEGFDPKVKQTEMFERYLVADERSQNLVDVVLQDPKKTGAG
jgi:transcriptional regulator with XRE-family HTH domain